VSGWQSGQVFATGPRLVLRDRLPEDLDAYLGAQFHGDHLQWDAPWEAAVWTAEAEATLRARFQDYVVREPPTPRPEAIIALPGGPAIGNVMRYGPRRHPDTTLVGISLWDASRWDGGLGTEALGLWVDHQFEAGGWHRVGLDTWSFNRRMARVAEKLGFRFEGAEREVHHWLGAWRDLLHFGLLRDAWQARRDAPTARPEAGIQSPGS
jgi:RimJ/RimL family protein N-acetyltransferase